MRATTFTMLSADGDSIFVYCWLPEQTPKGVVQIVHGWAGHAAIRTPGRGTLLRGLRGVRRRPSWACGTAQTLADIGFFAARDGWNKCVGVLWQLNQRIAADHANVPIVMLGHSLGSFLASNSSASMARRWPGPCCPARTASRR